MFLNVHISHQWGIMILTFFMFLIVCCLLFCFLNAFARIRVSIKAGKDFAQFQTNKRFETF